MLQQDGLSASMYSFFDRIHEYSIADDEYIELAWSPRDNDQKWATREVPDLDQAAVRAIALGTACDIRIGVRRRSRRGANDAGDLQPLVQWFYRERRPDDRYPLPGTDDVCLRYARDGRLGMHIRHFPDGDGTREAVMFSWRERPYRPIRYRITRALCPAPGSRQGGAW